MTHSVDQDVTWKSKNLHHSLYLRHRISVSFQIHERDFTKKKVRKRKQTLRESSLRVSEAVGLLHGGKKLTQQASAEHTKIYCC
jgi:hypothetical protein